MTVGASVRAIQDIMRKDAGVDGDAQRLGQLSWMFFLRILDAAEEEWELLRAPYLSVLPEDVRWRSWAANPEGMTGDTLLAFVDDKLFPMLRDLPLSGVNGPLRYVVRSVFEDAYNYMKNGTLVRQVVNKINEIDFNSAVDRHLFGDLYEEILRDLQSAGNAGEYYTPRAITEFMVDRVDPQLGEVILDPACGTGGFLANAIQHLRVRYAKSPDDEELIQQSIRGVEKKPLPHLLCITNMMLHGIRVPSNVRRDNTLARPLRDYGPRDRVDVILTNPPFGGIEEDGIEMNFPQVYRSRETADLFLTLIVQLLKPGGRAAIVLPDGTLFGEGVKTRIKERVLEECNLHTVVRLPAGVFNPYSAIRTNLLFLTKGEPTRDIWYYEHPYPAGYKSYSKTKPIQIDEFEAEKDWWHRRSESEHAWRVSIDEVRSRGFNLDIGNPNAPAAAQGDPIALLREYEASRAETERVRDQLKSALAATLNALR